MFECCIKLCLNLFLYYVIDALCWLLVFIGPPTECVLTQARTHYAGIALFVEPCSGSGLYLVLST